MAEIFSEIVQTTTSYSANNSAAADTKKPFVASDDDKTVLFGISVDNGALTRMMYILLGLTAILLIYFGIKLWRLRKKSAASVRRYDLLNSSESGIKTETFHLNSDLESEDEVFDDAHIKLVKKQNSEQKN